MSHTSVPPCVFPQSQLMDAAREVYKRCDELAEISCLKAGIGRYYLSPEHKVCNLKVADWMRSAGLEAWQDQAGNCWGRLRSKNPKLGSVILGSHLDTVAMAGRYDGILGVLSAIAVAAQLKASGIELPFHVDIAGFGDEEGTRFGSTLLGSAAVAGKWQEQWFELVDAQGVSLQQAMIDFGMQPSRVYDANRASDQVLAYLELHIEQGPVLEEMNLPVGVVSSIAGARRFEFSLQGMAGHAGTVPMAMRRDPLAASAQVMVEIEAIAQELGIVATVGQIMTYPGAVNVIPGECKFSLDVRSGDDSKRDLGAGRIIAVAKKICAARNIVLQFEETHSAPATSCAAWLQSKMRQVVKNQGIEALTLMSGAGHDAMMFGDMCDIGMLFLRCEQGISHNPLETVSIEDIASGLACFYALIGELQTSSRAVSTGESNPELSYS